MCKVAKCDTINFRFSFDLHLMVHWKWINTEKKFHNCNKRRCKWHKIVTKCNQTFLIIEIKYEVWKVTNFHKKKCNYFNWIYCLTQFWSNEIITMTVEVRKFIIGFKCVKLLLYYVLLLLRIAILLSSLCGEFLYSN